MKRVLIWVLSLWSVVGIGWSRSDDGLQELKAKDRLLSLLEKDAVSPGANSPMIPLTLIQGAASKGAGTSQTSTHHLLLAFQDCPEILILGSC